MITQPPPRPSEGLHKRDLVEMRIVNLRRELEANGDPWARAAVLYEIGSLYEHDLDREQEALHYYSEARLAVPEFQPATMARLRIVERAGSSAEVSALCLAQVAATGAPAIAGAATLDLALGSDEWADLLRQAIARAPEPVVPALLLEWLAEARGDQEAVLDALRAQAAHSADPVLRAALWVDVAIHQLDRGDIDEALESIDQASEQGQLAWAARSIQRRAAREHNRPEAFVAASTAMAGLLEAAAAAGADIDPLALPVPERERLPMAAFLWEEAAACCATDLDDPVRAASLAERALALFPDDVGTRLQALRFAEASGSDEALDGATSWFRETAANDPAFVTHQIRSALAVEERNRAMETLRELAARNPNSVYAQAALEVALIAGGARSERAARLAAAAGAADGDARARLLWHAAQLLSSVEGRFDDAQRLYDDAAAEDTQHRSAILREALGAAVRARDGEAIVSRCNDLLHCDIEPSERAELEYCRYDATKHLLDSEEEAKRLLRAALDGSDNHAWAPHVARSDAALDNDFELLAAAHRALAALTSDSARAGHLCAEGQAHARRRDWDAAERSLREAMQESPDDPFPVTLLENVLHEAGRTEAVVELSRERSGRRSGAALGELSLLLAGATAERNGDLLAARHAYEQALADAPSSPSAALALADVARRQNDTATVAEVYSALSEMDLGGGAPELFSLLRGDALAEVNPVEACGAYDRALDRPARALHAAAALLSMPLHRATDEQRAAGEEIFFDAGMPLTDPSDELATAYGPLRFALGRRDASTGEAWLRLAEVAPNESIAAATLLHGLRAARMARGEESADELFMLAQEAAPMSESNPEAAIAIDEALCPSDDPELRADALAITLRHSGSLGRSALDAAYCRTVVEAGRGGEAVVMLTDALDERPDDLALWETLRSAARRAEEWPLVAQACERLAQFVDGALEADLLEEAGVVRLDCLQQFQQAEDLFRRALTADPMRQVAFRRLRDLLAAREDAEALDALVSERLALGGPKDRPALLYDRARLLRGFSDRPGALEVLGELFTEEPNHAGALALAAEVHVSLAQWDEAVECLRKLSRADISDDQRCAAHLGAADFLESHLRSKEEALAELRAVDELGLADPRTLAWMGRLEESLGRTDAAAETYARAVESDPVNTEAIAGLVRLGDGAEVEPTIERYERAIWRRIEEAGIDESLLGGLQRAASWRGDLARAEAIVAAQRALGLVPSADADGGRLELHGSVDSMPRDCENAILEAVLVHAEPAVTQSRARAERAGRAALESDPSTPFAKGQLAWATPRSAGWMIAQTPETAAGTLAAILRAARCQLASGEPALPAAQVKLRRSIRKQVRETVGDETFTPAALVDFARSVQQTADRAGLLTSGDLVGALTTLLNGNVTLASLNASARALDLLRFAIDVDSPLRRNDG